MTNEVFLILGQDRNTRQITFLCDTQDWTDNEEILPLAFTTETTALQYLASNPGLQETHEVRIKELTKKEYDHYEDHTELITYLWEKRKPKELS